MYHLAHEAAGLDFLPSSIEYSFFGTLTSELCLRLGSLLLNSNQKLFFIITGILFRDAFLLVSNFEPTKMNACACMRECVCVCVRMRECVCVWMCVCAHACVCACEASGYF